MQKTINNHRILSYIGLIVILSIFSSAASPDEEIVAAIRKLVENGSVMLNDESGRPLIALNPDTPLIPASIIKVLTSLIALDLLGADFRFKTEFYIDKKSNLIIKGFGDPFLVSDEIRAVAAGLKSKGLTRINKIILDVSFFSDDLTIPGISNTSNPYDALNGALVVNFNTINVKKELSGNIVSAEEETPLTPLAIEKAKYFTPGSSRRVNLSAQRADCMRYAGELFQAVLAEQGLTIADSTVIESSVRTDGPPFYTHFNTRSLSEVLRGLLKYSNNFIANQIFLFIGAEKKGPPATMAKSTSVFENYIRENMKIPPQGLVVVEGSGISRDNQVSGRVMAAIMEMFKPYSDLLTPKNRHPLKSGTLNGVNNYAGYIRTPRGLRSFVIILNQEKNNRDDVLKLLEKY